MTWPMNAPHERRFGDPNRRPSNERADPVVEHTRWRVRQLAAWLDTQNVVDEAEAILKPRRVTGGDPDE